MESEDKRHIQRKCGRVSIFLVWLLALSACRSQADRTGPAPSGPSAIPAATVGATVDAVDAGRDAAGETTVVVPAPRPCLICGEWERQSEPYKGMRITIREGAASGVVTRSSTVDAGAKNKAQLECQRSLWKPGDVLLTMNDAGTAIVVRDWGLTGGVCRHQDSKAEAAFIFADPDVLALTVTRGKTRVVQEWTRVR
jgi:hypothetical protein